MEKAAQCYGKNAVEKAGRCCGKNSLKTAGQCCGKSIVITAGQCCGKGRTMLWKERCRKAGRHMKITDLLFVHHPISAVLFLLHLSQKSLHKQKKVIQQYAFTRAYI